MKPQETDKAAHVAAHLDRLIEWLMIVLLVFMPFAFGAVALWSRMVCVVITAAMAVCLALKIAIGDRAAFVWCRAYVPIGLFLLLAVLQQVQLPTAVVEAVSPNTAAVKTGLLGDLPNADDFLEKMTLSFYPHATRDGLRDVLVAAIVFVVVVNVYRRGEQIKRLLAAIAAIGGAVALLALVQVLSGTAKIYWLVPLGFKEVANSASFVNHSHFGQFMNLSIGAAVALLLVEIREKFDATSLALPGIVERLGRRDLRVVWCLAAVIAAGVVGIFLSLTRGGIIALLIAGGFTTLVLALKRGLADWRWGIAVAMAMVALVVVLYVGFDAVYERLASLSGEDFGDGRWQILKDISIAWTRFPLFGVGLGSHEVVYPMFNRSTIPALAAYAENEYAQLAEETGLVGLGLLGALAVMVWRAYWRCVRKVHLPIRAASFGLGFGLLAIMIQSLSDFGQHLLANACLSAVFAALLIALDGMAKPTPLPSVKRNGKGLSRFTGILVLAGTAAVCSWAVISANNARAGEAHWKRALTLEHRLQGKRWLADNRDYAALIWQAQAAVKYQGDNVKYRHWLNVYRWRSISRVVDSGSGEVVVSPAVLRHTRRIVDELNAARALCPTFGPTYCLLGQLEKFILDRPIGAKHIATAYALAPCDATACYAAGLLDALEGRFAESLTKFRRSLTLDNDLFPYVADVYLRRVTQPRLAVAATRDDFSRLLYVTALLQARGDDQDLTAEAVALLKARCDRPDAPADVLAAMADACYTNRDYQDAIKYFRRALALQHGQVEWRLNMARCLARTGQVKKAVLQARACLRLRPQMTTAMELITELTTLRGTGQDSDS